MKIERTQGSKQKNRSKEGDRLCLRPDTHQGRDCDLLRNFFSAAPDMVFYKNASGAYIGCSKLFAEFVNRTPADLTGITDSSLFDTSVVTQIAQLEQFAIESGCTQTRMLSFDSLTRHVLLFQATATPLQEEDGTLLGVLGVWRDVTRRVADENRLRESEASLSAFFDCSRDFMFIVDESGAILKANRIAHERLGYTADELRGMPLLQLHPEKHRTKAAKILDEMKAGTLHRCTLPLISRSGAVIPAETEVAYGKWKGQTVMFATSRDVSAQRIADQTIRHLSALQHQLMRFSTEFVNAPLERSDEAIRKSLKAVGSLIKADRAYLFEYDFQGGWMHNTHEWCNKGIKPEIANLQNQPLDHYPEWVAAHRHGELVHIPSVAALKPTEPTYQTLAAQSIQSLITLPLMSNKQCLGFVGFDAVKQQRVWGKEEIDLLRVLAEAFANLKMRLRAEQELHKKNIDMGLLLDTMTAQVWYLKDAETYGLVNRAHAEFLGLQREDIQHRPFRDFLASNEADICLTVNREVFRTGKASTSQEWLRSGTGERRLFEIVKNPQVDPDGQVAYVVCVAYDITEKASLQEELVQARDEAEKTAERKQRFLADMSHEIRTPLNVILGFLQLMDRECGDCPKKGRLEILRKSGNHLLDLINDILTVIRLDSEHVLLSPSVFDLILLIEDLKDVFTQSPSASHLAIETLIDSKVPRLIFSDKSKLRQILMNLAGNAVKFTDKGTVVIRVGVALPTRSAKTGDGFALPSGASPCRIVVEVEDSGCGIAADQQESIFSPFVQLEKACNLKTGSGLGLPLSRRYARALGGDITVTSEPGKGSTFTLTFETHGVSAENMLRELSVPRHVIVAGTVPPRILVVDDHPEGRAIQVEMLVGAGFNIDTADSGEQALTLLGLETPYVAVLLDKRMPGLDGYATLKRIRALPKRSQTPVLMLTASGFSDEREDVLKSSGNGLLTKPFTREQLLEAIERATGLPFAREDVPFEITTKKCDSDSAENRVPTVPLPEKWRKKIETAVHEGDIAALRALAQKAHADLPCHASYIGGLVEKFDYNGLLRLCGTSGVDPHSKIMLPT